MRAVCLAATASVDDRRLVRGLGQYTADWSVPDKTYAAFIRSPHAQADVLSICTDLAQASSGVLAVLTGADCRLSENRDIGRFCR
jgi:carbon-monoxide dehydrogenase large subunit